MAKDKICRPFVGIIAPENKFTVDTIDDLKSRNYLTIGDIVDLNGYYTAGDGAHHKRKIESADDGSGVQLANGLWANIVHDGEVNVSWFGAKGDGVADDTDAIQKVFSNYNNITFKGMCKCKTLDIIKSNINLIVDFDNCLFDASYGFNLMGNVEIKKLIATNCLSGVVLNGERNIIQDCKITMSSSSLRPLTAWNVRFANITNSEFGGGNISLLLFSDVKTEDSVAIVKNCKFTGSDADDNLQLINIKNVHVINNTSKKSKRSGIVLRSCESGVIESNTCYSNTSDSTKQGGWGIAISLGNRNIKVINNTCYDNENGGISIDVYKDDYKTELAEVVCSNNSIWGSGSSNIFLNGVGNGIISGNFLKTTQYPLVLNECENVVVSENVFEKTKQGYVLQTSEGTNRISIKCNLILLNTSEVDSVSTVSLIPIIDSNNVDISNNTIKVFGSSNIGKRNIFEINKSNHVNIRNNTVVNDLGSDKLFVDIRSCSVVNVNNNTVDGIEGCFQFFLAYDGASSKIFVSLNTISKPSNGFIYSRSVGNKKNCKAYLNVVDGCQYNADNHNDNVFDTPIIKGSIISYLSKDTETYKKYDGTEMLSLLQLNTPYHATKMQQEGVYDDFIAYMDEQHEYEQLQREVEEKRQEAYQLALAENPELTYEEWLATQPVLIPDNEPQPSEKLLEFKNKYIV